MEDTPVRQNRMPPALLLCVLSLLTSAVLAEESSPAERQFESLRKRYQSEVDRYFMASERAKSDEERTKLYNDLHPANTMQKVFVEFEEQNRGTQIGVSSLHQLVSAAGAVGDPEATVSQGRGAALKTLTQHYAAHPDLDIFFPWLGTGASCPEAKPFLSRACSSPHRHVRGAARVALVERLADDVCSPPLIDTILELLRDEPAKNAERIKRFEESKGRRPADPEPLRQEALRLIDEVVAGYPDVLMPPRTPYGPILVKIERTDQDPLTKQPRQTLAERATSLRFELTELGIGQTAPDIVGPDAFGKDRTLRAERGKVVVLMFSFKGCVPCEAMYPGNRQLMEKYAGRRFSFLGVMADVELATVKEAVAEGAITWPVWWDAPGGPKGPLSTRWNVTSWPDTFVLDDQGVIRFRKLRGDLLEMAVAKLLDRIDPVP